MSVKEKIVAYFIERELKKKENQEMVGKIATLWNVLEGKKSTWLVIVSLVAMFGNIAGFIDAEQTKQVLAICGAGYAGTMAEKINRLIKVLKEAAPQSQPTTTPPQP